uniref:Uncharacterized protein n=1 Tax=viral metagenome TaxID=1070528 RepID=A0A6M3LWL1_9ZZZZ
MTEKILPTSSWYLPPTPAQVRAITKLAIALQYHEPIEEKVRTRLEARNIIVGFKEELKRRRK